VDVILGMNPLARELLRMWSNVIMVDNAYFIIGTLGFLDILVTIMAEQPRLSVTQRLDCSALKKQTW
jgi:hypothetical protein